MQKIFTIILIFISAPIISQESVKKNSLKLNTSEVIFGLYELKYERALSSRHSIGLAFGTGKQTKNNKSADRKFERELETDFFSSGDRDNEYRLEVFQTATLTYRYYALEKGFIEGLYFSPEIQYYHLREQYTSDNSNIIADNIYILFNCNAKIGYQYNLGKKLQVNPYIGYSESIKSANPYDARGVKVQRFGAGSNLLYGLDIGVRF